MTSLPEHLLQSLSGIPGYNREAFEQVHASGEQVHSIRINPKKIHSHDQLVMHFPVAAQVPWCNTGYYLRERPAYIFDPLLHAGCYYVQEASSMFLAQALQQSVDMTQPLKVLDLCAAPGGKSTLLQSLLPAGSLLVSNEVIKARAAVLEENLVKWGAINTVVTNNDPVHFARLDQYFDVLVVDAPCSGSGLFRRDPAAIQEWSQQNVDLCSQRQQRILADAWPALKPGGLLIYSTCAYSREEDEDIVDWVLSSFDASAVELQSSPDWHITPGVSQQHSAPGYRFYPYLAKGEGLFMAVIKKNGDATHERGSIHPAQQKNKTVARQKQSKVQLPGAEDWISDVGGVGFFMQHDEYHAFPESLLPELSVLQSHLYIRRAGIAIGKLAGGTLVPAHALAVSEIINTHIPRVSLSHRQAIHYLRRDELPLETGFKGWALAEFEGHPLGWMKILPNRFNNYYPKEWRILKSPD